MNKEQAADLIETSFLSDTDKQPLLARLHSEGPNTDLFQAFDRALAAEVKRRGQLYQVAMEQFNQHVATLEADIAITKEKLRKKVAEILLVTPIEDTPKRQRLLNEYKAKLQQLLTRYEQGVSQIAQKVTTL
jgi:hypothetical protein